MPIGVYPRKYDFDKGDIIKDEKRNITILERTKVQVISRNKQTNLKAYKCICNKCGYIDILKEIHLKNGRGCRCCHGTVVVLGINTAYDTDKWMIPYLVNPEEAKEHTAGSRHFIQVKCPVCGQIKPRKMRFAELKSQGGVSCPWCSSGKSLGERYVVNLLDMLNIPFINECGKKHLPWINDRKRYDFYIPNYEIIIEINGFQHYMDSEHFKTSVKDVQKNDKLKKELAISNGMKYVEIKYLHSYTNELKKSILDSSLPSLLNFSEDDIDWNQLAIDSENSLINKICNTYKTITHNQVAIGKMFHISDETVRRYLIIGDSYGLVKYEPFICQHIDDIYVYDKDWNLMVYSDDATKLANYLTDNTVYNFDVTNIRNIIDRIDRRYYFCHFTSKPIVSKSVMIEQTKNIEYKNVKQRLNVYDFNGNLIISAKEIIECSAIIRSTTGDIVTAYQLRKKLKKNDLFYYKNYKFEVINNNLLKEFPVDLSTGNSFNIA